MEKILIVVMAVVATSLASTTTRPPGAQQTITPPPGAQGCVRPEFPFVSSLLQTLGFPHTCITAALEACSSSGEGSSITSLIKEARDLVSKINETIDKTGNRPRHCKDLLDSGDSGSGVRLVYPYPGQPYHRVPVYCDHTIDGGGWTVFQKRTDGVVREDFIRTWLEYQLGFGSLEGEFWLGLDLLHQLTSTTLQELRIDLADYEGTKRWAKYGFFNVGPTQSKYRLSVGRYSGDAGDGFSAGGHDGSPFSTHDADNDLHETNCAERFKAGWWYAKCHISNLNGYQYEGNHTTYADGINWRPWRGYHYSLRRATMMIRPAF